MVKGMISGRAEYVEGFDVRKWITFLKQWASITFLCKLENRSRTW
jgi:hypothetical protein